MWSWAAAWCVGNPTRRPECSPDRAGLRRHGARHLIPAPSAVCQYDSLAPSFCACSAAVGGLADLGAQPLPKTAISSGCATRRLAPSRARRAQPTSRPRVAAPGPVRWRRRLPSWNVASPAWRGRKPARGSAWRSRPWCWRCPVMGGPCNRSRRFESTPRRWLSTAHDDRRRSQRWR